jgi:hypothetical protein
LIEEGGHTEHFPAKGAAVRRRKCDQTKKAGFKRVARVLQAQSITASVRFFRIPERSRQSSPATRYQASAPELPAKRLLNQPR